MKTPEVEFIYEKDCPNVVSTRMQLLKAFMQLKLKPHWREWEINDRQTPIHVESASMLYVGIIGLAMAGGLTGKY